MQIHLYLRIYMYIRAKFCIDMYDWIHSASYNVERKPISVEYSFTAILNWAYFLSIHFNSNGNTLSAQAPIKILLSSESQWKGYSFRASKTYIYIRPHM